MVTVASFGAWASPITTGLLARDGIRLGGVALDGARAYWLEGRPLEGGRAALVRADAHGARHDVVAAPFSVRSRVHEYGGGAFLVASDVVWFINDEDQRIHRAEAGAAPRPLTAAGRMRFADLVLDAARGRIVCVAEQHFDDGREAVNLLVAVDLADGSMRMLAQGHDFYASPRLSPDGSRLAWLTWDHPDMPWDATTLWVAAIDGAGALVSPQRVAGGDAESVFQPLFRDDGLLFFVADADGWWNLHCWDGARRRCVLPMQAEFGRPQWEFGMQTYGFDARGRIVCCYCRSGLWRLATLDADTGRLDDIDTWFEDIQALAVEGEQALLIGGAPTRGEVVARVQLASHSVDVLREAAPTKLAPAVLSRPEAIDFATDDGGRAFAFFYPPCNADFRAPVGERPPLLVISHDGPTSASTVTLRLSIQFWTSRGFAVLDVNYRGSSGYGRAYREALRGRWGIVDVSDCIAGARWAAHSGRADAARLVIRGASAGGYTTLAALTFHDVFAAGASYYGISDLEALARDTHKFESRYLDALVGPYPAQRERYVARSPIHAADRLSRPVIFFQGLDDPVVSPTQAQTMVDALRAKGLPVAYLAFEGERHGFRRADTIKRALQAELAFYARVLGFEVALDSS